MQIGIWNEVPAIGEVLADQRDAPFVGLVADLGVEDDEPRREVAVVERERLARANATERVYAVPSTLHAWVEEQSARTPHALAVICGEQSLTYAALNERADRLARHLGGLGVGPDVLVGVCLERSLDLPVAMLGILKAGGAYVPLDPEYPLERLSFMMQDSGLRLLVSERRVLEGRPSTPLPLFLMDEDFARLEAAPSPGDREQ